MYKKILVPYDDSEPANRALDHAVNLAKMSGQSEVILLHVIAEYPSYHLSNSLLVPLRLVRKRLFLSTSKKSMSLWEKVQMMC
jgi:nucleotide-binding universal stress UspA family protein